MDEPNHPIPGLDFDKLAEFVGWHIPNYWSIEIVLASRCVVVWVQDDTDRDSRIATEDMSGCGDLSLMEAVLVAVNYAREQKGLKPVEWEDKGSE